MKTGEICFKIEIEYGNYSEENRSFNCKIIEESLELIEEKYKKKYNNNKFYDKKDYISECNLLDVKENELSEFGIEIAQKLYNQIKDVDDKSFELEITVEYYITCDLDGEEHYAEFSFRLIKELN